MRNLLIVEREYLQRAVCLTGRPYKVILDPCNICYMGCRLCPHGLHELKIPREMMDLQTFKTIVDLLKEFAFEISLHNWGEPLLHPDIFQMISHVKASHVGTNMSTTLATAGRKEIEELIKSGLEYLVVSIDGVSPETYNTYVPRGDFHKVMDNLRTLVRRRIEVGSRFPIIEWQFLVMRHNEHEISRVREMSREIGVDRLRVASAGLPMGKVDDRSLAEQWMPKNPNYWRLNPLKLKYQPYLLDQSCFYLYRSITVNPNGEVSPCCTVYDERYSFGNLLADGLEGVWNNEAYQSARTVFAKKHGRDVQDTICNTCRLFRKPQDPRS